MGRLSPLDFPAKNFLWILRSHASWATSSNVEAKVSLPVPLVVAPVGTETALWRKGGSLRADLNVHRPATGLRSRSEKGEVGEGINGQDSDQIAIIEEKKKTRSSGQLGPGLRLRGARRRRHQ